MANPIINFRLSKYQIARGLWIVRKLEPAYKPSSASKMIKMLYLDYLAKMSYGHSDVVPTKLLQEVNDLISSSRKKEIQLEELIPQQKSTIFEMPSQADVTTSEADESIISTATDLSPPTSWLENIQEENE